MEQYNKAMVAEEMDKMNIELDQEKAEIRVKLAESRQYKPQEGAALEIQVAELKGEKSVVAFQVRNKK